MTVAPPRVTATPGAVHLAVTITPDAALAFEITPYQALLLANELITAASDARQMDRRADVRVMA